MALDPTCAPEPSATLTTDEKETVMAGSNWERFAALTGVAFVVLVVVGFAIGGSTPGAHSSALKADTFYTKHHDKEMAGAFIVAIAAAFLPFFASTLRRALDWSGGTGRLATASFRGGIIASGGVLVLPGRPLAPPGAPGKTTPPGAPKPDGPCKKHH